MHCLDLQYITAKNEKCAEIYNFGGMRSMPWYDKTVQSMKPNRKYTRQQLISMLREDAPLLNDGSYQWAIGGMLKSGEIIRTGFDEYKVLEGNELPEYHPVYSDFAAALMNKTAEKYPYIGFTVFETVLLNDFLNHLIARNTVFLQIEKESSAFVFRFLQEAGYKNVMYKPAKTDFNLYWDEDCIVVTDMVSEAPMSLHNPHFITIEKMLVDIYCDKIIRGTYSIAEYPSVMSQAMNTYRVEGPKMLRYARRRNKAIELEQIIAGL